MAYLCPLNLKITDDCCVSDDLRVDTIDTNNIINSSSINTPIFLSNESFVKTLYFDNGQMLSTQATDPVVTVAGAGLTGASIMANSTDIAGIFGLTGTPGQNSSVMLTFHVPFPPGSIPVVIVTGDSDQGAVAIKVGIYVASSYNNFIIHFPIGGAYGANPVFNYRVICPITA